uniref:Uncharacterized protein n=1 Tax=Anguilla anguilla TaxID=7936 RepID=A0A0E9SXD4_ANGAN
MPECMYILRKPSNSILPPCRGLESLVLISRTIYYTMLKPMLDIQYKFNY